MGQRMTSEQLQSFHDQLIIAIEQHLANGGQIVSGSFGYQDKICPISTLFRLHGLITPHLRISQDLSDVLGFTVSTSEMFAFTSIFDGAEKLYTLDVEYPEMARIANEIRQKYLPPKRSVIRRLRDLIGV